jgi:hypothetical protein
MESLEFKGLMTSFGRQLRQIEESLLQAVAEEIDDNTREQAIDNGREKLKEHARVLEVLSNDSTKRDQFIARYDELVDSIRKSLEKLG